MSQQPGRHICKVRIENFQSHEDTEFELGPGLNLLVGSSEAGKSAVLRAINLALHNEPRGDGFVRLDTDEARIHVWYSDKTYVQRIKGGDSGRNVVLWETPDGESDGRDNFGVKLPKEYQQVLGMPPVDDWHGPTSYADQMDPLFLVSLGPTMLPRAISKLIAIDDFEEAAQILASKAKAAGKQIKDSSARISAIEKQLEDFDGLDEQLKELDTLVVLANDIDDKFQTIDSAHTLLQNYDEVMRQGKVAYKALQDANKIAELSSELQPIVEQFSILNQARELLMEHKRLLSEEIATRKSLDRAVRLCGNDIKDAQTAALVQLEQISSVQSLLNEYEHVMKQGRAIKTEQEKQEVVRATLIKEKNELIREMKAEGIWCNVCQRPLALDECV